MLGVLGSTVGLVQLACINGVVLLDGGCSFMKRHGSIRVE
jgi:hypothetical protein